MPPDVQTPKFSFEDDSFGIFQSRTLKMEVWLDGPILFDPSEKIISTGNVIQAHRGNHMIGGKWKMGQGYLVDAWPDTMLVPKAIAPSTGYRNPEIDFQWINDHILNPVE